MSQTECNCGCDDGSYTRVPVRGLELCLDTSAIGGGTAGEMMHFDIGVETKRNMTYRGKQVYSKLIDFGVLPNKTTKSVPHGVGDYDWMNVDPQFSTVVYTDGKIYGVDLASTLGAAYSWFYRVEGENICMQTGVDRTPYTAIICLNYTKLTDPVIA